MNRAYWIFYFALVLWVLVSSYNDAKMRTVNKCDRLCLKEHRYPVVKFKISLKPLYAWECGCEGFGRMPDEYLR